MASLTFFTHTVVYMHVFGKYNEELKVFVYISFYNDAPSHLKTYGILYTWKRVAAGLYPSHLLEILIKLRVGLDLSPKWGFREKRCQDSLL